MQRKNKTSITKSQKRPHGRFSSIRSELLPPSPTLTEADFKRMVAQAIEQRVNDALSHGSDADFQPWFQPREISNEIIRRQTVAEQQKFSYYFEDWGCIICATKDKPHYTLGFCQTCYSRVAQRIQASIRKHSPPPDHSNLNFIDTVRMAREALAPALHVLPESTARTARRKRGS